MIRFFTFIFVFVFYFSASHSQNYSTVTSDTTYYSHYFNTPFYGKQKVNCFYVDSTATVPGGIECFGYMRFYQSWSSNTEWSRKSWLGVTIIRLNNGNDVFTNDDGENIVIQTQSNPGTSWVMYNYPSGDFIEATVTGIDTVTFLGITDSVKTIMLLAKDANGFPIPGNYNNKDIRITQNHGFLKTYGFNTFPFDTAIYQLSGIEGNLQGFQHLPFQDLFDFNIGDEFHYRNRTSTSAPYTYNVFHERIVLNKTISANGDTIKYLYDNIFYSESWSFGNVTTYFQHDTIDYPYVIFSANGELDGLPEEVLPAGITSPVQQYGYSIPYHDTSYHSRSRIFSENYFEYDTTCSCLMWPVGMGIFPSRVYAKGLGEVYETDPTYNVRYDSLVYYKKGSEEWGNRLNWSVILGIQDSPTGNGIKSYPNPAKDKFYIESDDPFEKPVDFELITPAGQLIYNTKLSGRINEIPCNNLSAGIYLYRIIYADGRSFVNKIAVR